MEKDYIYRVKNEKTTLSRLNQHPLKSFSLDNFITPNQKSEVTLREKFEDILGTYKLATFTDDLFNLIQYKVRIREISLSCDQEIPIGEMKFGGNPDVPEGFEWPYWKEYPLSFLFQVDLNQLNGKKLEFNNSEIDSVDLPEKIGFLYFFYDYHQRSWGDDPDDEGCWRVKFEKSLKSELLRTQNPSNDKKYTYDPYTVSLHNDISLPIGGLHVDSELIKNIGFTSKEETSYYKFVHEWFSWDTNWNANWMFGHPVGIYEDRNNVRCEHFFSREKNLEEAKQWTLLLLLGRKFDFEWGNGGFLQFWIKNMSKGFENTWALIESINTTMRFYQR